MQMPPSFLPQPLANWDEETLASFEALYTQTVKPGTSAVIDYKLSAPKWQFLCYLADRKNILMHGTGNADIAEFEPRQSNDIEEFGNRRAVYAASDGIWALYFAIVDRDNYVTSLMNACFRVIIEGRRTDPYYFFSINEDALPHNPWREGMIYLLPGNSFEQQPNQSHQGLEIEVAHWASLVPVKPLAKLPVGPEDFPFLAQIRPHNPATLRERAMADPAGFPWIEE